MQLDKSTPGLMVVKGPRLVLLLSTLCRRIDSWDWQAGTSPSLKPSVPFTLLPHPSSD